MRLVDADMLIKTIPTEEINARMAIATAPTIEAEPIKHGRWIIIDGEVVCSECCEHNLETNYCPNCGARMDERSNER